MDRFIVKKPRVCEPQPGIAQGAMQHANYGKRNDRGFTDSSASRVAALRLRRDESILEAVSALDVVALRKALPATNSTVPKLSPLAVLPWMTPPFLEQQLIVMQMYLAVNQSMRM